MPWLNYTYLYMLIFSEILTTRYGIILCHGWATNNYTYCCPILPCSTLIATGTRSWMNQFKLNWVTICTAILYIG